MKEIEIFQKQPTSTKEPPLLFIHGACLGAWCWTDNFLDYFGDLGYHTLALNLRGHGGSVSDKPLQKLRLDNYVEDVASVADKLAEPPIVVGHSMGGLVAQMFASQHETSAVVLISPSPYAGMQSQAVNRMEQYCLKPSTKPRKHIVRHVTFSMGWDIT